MILRNISVYEGRRLLDPLYSLMGFIKLNRSLTGNTISLISIIKQVNYIEKGII